VTAEPIEPPADDPSWGWLDFADVLLQRAALLARVAGASPSAPPPGALDPDEELRLVLAAQPGSDDQADATSAVLTRTAGAVAAARRGLAAALVADTPFNRVVRRARLAPEEIEAFAVIAAVELDGDRQALVRQVSGAPSLTPFSLGRMFAGLDPQASPVAPDGALHRAALLVQVSGPTWASTPLRLAPLVGWWLLGEQPRDPDLAADAEIVEVPGLGDADLILVAGLDRVRRLQAVVASLAAPRLLLTPLPDTTAGWDAVIRTATLAGCGVVLEVQDVLPPAARNRVDAADHLSWAVTSPAELPVDSLPRRPWRYRPAGPPDATVAEIGAVFGPAAEHLPMILSATQVQQVAELVPRFGGDPVQTVRWLAHGRLDQFARRVRPVATWDDLVLPADRLVLVREVMIRQQHRRRVFTDWSMARGAPAATIALFAGPSGTGKTLAAEVISGALALDLYQVDVSALVSKYIGETEKNLARLFDAAESVPCVLFFDEADALFGKRSEVSDAHDRYANIETSYLLQRLERHNGIVVLASNLAANLDKAFARRIHVAVDFPLPGRAERRRIWDRSLPAERYRAELDLTQLADRFELAGGNIRNAALRAAFLASDAGSMITMPLVLEALRREMAKLGRRFPG